MRRFIIAGAVLGSAALALPALGQSFTTSSPSLSSSTPMSEGMSSSDQSGILDRLFGGGSSASETSLPSTTPLPTTTSVPTMSEGDSTSVLEYIETDDTMSAPSSTSVLDFESQGTTPDGLPVTGGGGMAGVR